MWNVVPNTFVSCAIAGPGFVKDDFFKYLQEEMVRRDDRPFIQNMSKFILCKASSGHKHALDEVLSHPAIMARMNDTKVAREVEALNAFMRMMEVDPDRAYYGFAHVSKAQEQLAVDTLLLTDQLFRSSNVKTRKEYVTLVEEARAAGGESTGDNGKEERNVFHVLTVHFSLPVF